MYQMRDMWRGSPKVVATQRAVDNAAYRSVFALAHAHRCTPIDGRIASDIGK